MNSTALRLMLHRMAKRDHSRDVYISRDQLAEMSHEEIRRTLGLKADGRETPTAKVVVFAETVR